MNTNWKRNEPDVHHSHGFVAYKVNECYKAKNRWEGGGGATYFDKLFVLVRINLEWQSKQNRRCLLIRGTNIDSSRRFWNVGPVEIIPASNQNDLTVIW